MKIRIKIIKVISFIYLIKYNIIKLFNIKAL